MSLPVDMADDIPMPLVAIDDGEITWVNLSAQEWLDASLKGLKGQALTDVFLGFDQAKDACLRSELSRAPVSIYDLIIQRENKADERVNLTVFPLQKGTGLLFHLQGAKPSQIGREQSGEPAVSAMGRMLAHEIKNPLAGISGAAQLLRADVETEEGRSLIELIRSETARIRRLADRMESLGERNPENVGPVNIQELLTSARKIIQSASPSNIEFSETYDPSTPIVTGDPDTLMQAILNLIKNASEAIENTGLPGEIHLETSFRSGVMRRLRSKSKQLPVEIRITDTGPGIPTDMQTSLFQPFVTSKPTGQGLGLSLVSKVANAHGGLVEHSSRPGKTVFSILLPLGESDEI